MYDFDAAQVQAQLRAAMASDATLHMPFPFGDLVGPDGFYETCYAPLLTALPDLERRDFIVVAGPTSDGANWVGCAGQYLGTFDRPWLDIPPTGHLVHMRFHEFYRFENNKIVEVQAVWDIPEVMIQARAWPLAPALGREWATPAPATQDGLVTGPWDKAQADASCQCVIDMYDHMQRHPAQGGPEVMEMPRFWHPRMTWYGPAGIGTARGIDGFRNWHQIPFLKAMPDRGQHEERTKSHFFGDGPYAAVTGWPNMYQTISSGGWLGIAPAGKEIEMRSLDFWRIEQGVIRENWVLIDLLHVYDQIGVDVFGRMREFNKARRH